MIKAYGLYTQIRQNRQRSVLLLAGFVALLQALVYAFALLFTAGHGRTVADMLAGAWHEYLFIAPFAFRKVAQQNSLRHRSMMVESNA